MTNLHLPPVGVALSYKPGDAFLDAMTELEELGYATIWLSGGRLPSTEALAEVVRATRKIQVASGILPVDRFGAEAVAATYAETEAAHSGRLLVGLGGAYGPRPLRTLGTYLDHLDTVAPVVPASARMLAALGPRMLQLARDRAAGAYPLLVTPRYTEQARALLGGAAALVVSQFVVLETNPRRARDLARGGPLGFLSRQPGYAANLARMGFSEEEITRLSDRLVDAVVAWGDVDVVAERVQEHLQAGADQVALSVIADIPGTLPVESWRELAGALIPSPAVAYP